jgi:hypothetical protein
MRIGTSLSQWARQAAGIGPVTLGVRPAATVVAGAIPGTIRIPLCECRDGLAELPSIVKSGAILAWIRRHIARVGCRNSTGSKFATWSAGVRRTKWSRKERVTVKSRPFWERIREKVACLLVFSRK